MTGSQLPDALTILDRVLEAPESDRTKILQESCGDDRDLRREVEALLAFESGAGHFLDAPILASFHETGTLQPGTRIGAYEIVELIGRGGMGEVYRARRAEDYQALVAIKLLHADGLVPGALQRFHLERQILAELEHPSIARLLDGGTTGQRPYLVMEHIEGLPLDDYCRLHGFTVREQLKLFRRVCLAVAFAHRNLVVHRDLKPNNILVTTEGFPKLLDFGIAKLLRDATPEASPTLSGIAPMTPRYASPEQIQGRPVTTATDVYSLGVLLFELLTGDLPGQLAISSPAEIARIICDEQPLKPSTEVKSKASKSSAKNSESRHLVKLLRGDLDTIVMKTLRKEPDERYPSAEALSEDVRRHLEGLPVEARKGNRLYIAEKFIRRNRTWLFATSVALVALVGFALRENRRLDFEQHRSQQLEQVLEELILTADPDTGLLTSTKLLAKAEEQIQQLDDEPRLRGEVLDSLGWIHRKLGDNERALDLAARSLEVWRQQQPKDDPDMALRLNNLGVLELERGEYGKAETLFREALAMRDRLGEVESEAMTTNRANLGAVLINQGVWSEAESLLRQVLTLRKNTLGANHPKVASSLRSLGALQHARGDFESAEPLLRQALKLRLENFGEDHTAVASVLDLLGRARFALGDLEEAERLLVRSINIRFRRLGQDHRSLSWSELNLGQVLLSVGELATARVLIVRSYSNLLATEPSNHWRLARARSVLGSLFLTEGAAGKARACFESAVAELREKRGEDATYTREAQKGLDKAIAATE